MNDKNIELLDLLNVLSFSIGLLNYQENLTQGDKQDLMKEVDRTTKIAITEIRSHLEEQDIKINQILEVLNEKDKKTN